MDRRSAIRGMRGGADRGRQIFIQIPCCITVAAAGATSIRARREVHLGAFSGPALRVRELHGMIRRARIHRHWSFAEPLYLGVWRIDDQARTIQRLERGVLDVWQ